MLDLWADLARRQCIVLGSNSQSTEVQGKCASDQSNKYTAIVEQISIMMQSSMPRIKQQISNADCQIRIVAAQNPRQFSVNASRPF